MATSISGTTLTYPSGSTQTTGGGKVINYDFDEYSVRTSLPTSANTYFWTPNISLTRSSSTSYIHIEAQMTGHGNYSYPMNGTFHELIRPDNSRVRVWHGCLYQPNLESGAQEIIFLSDYVFTPSEIGTQTGTYGIAFGWDVNDGSGGHRWCNIWNPNSNDDGRAAQTGSTCFMSEVIYG